MTLLYKYAQFPDDHALVQRIATAADGLYEKLAALDPDRLDLSDYNRKYLARYQRKLCINIQKFAYVLVWSLAGSSKRLERTVLLEYGGGSGILSLLAKECGIGTVIYNDIYDVSCIDAETIGQATGNRADHYVCGDIDDVADSLKRNSISCDAIVSSDVIEHIHNIEVFFKNPVMRRLLIKQQKQVEYEDREYSSGHKKRDSLKSYLSIRRDIIRDCSDGLLSNDEVEKLARMTRGMIDPLIRSTVFTYLESKELPPAIGHPTNTCDPKTGNWADRLVDPSELMAELSRMGFNVEMQAGRYGRPNGLVRQIVAGILDLVITLSRRPNLVLAPYFLIHGSGTMSLERQEKIYSSPEAVVAS